VSIGYVGGRVDAIVSRFLDVLLGFPAIVKAILVVAVLGVGLVNVVIAVAIAGMPRFARVVRGAVLAAREQLWVESARALGASDLRIMLRHLLPNVVPSRNGARCSTRGATTCVTRHGRWCSPARPCFSP
jgi:ABC-type dipeptide/oligopeptide/nickel transport system permease subunit